MTSPFPSAQGHQLRIWTSNVNACFVGTTDNPSLSFVPYPNKMCYRFSFLAECTVAGTMYPDMLEKSLITIFEEEGPNVILQHNSLRLLKTESFQKMYVHRQLGHFDTFFPTLPPLQLQKMSFACVHCPPLSEHSGWYSLLLPQLHLHLPFLQMGRLNLNSDVHARLLTKPSMNISKLSSIGQRNLVI